MARKGSGPPIPRKLNAGVIKALCDPIAKRGLPVRHSAALLDIHESTIYRWIQLGNADVKAGNAGTIYAKLCKAIARARALDTDRRLTRLDEFAGTDREGDRSVDVWFLSRTSKEFRDKQDICLSDGDGGPVQEVVKVEIIMPKDEK